jgi:hypothetical protein
MAATGLHKGCHWVANKLVGEPKMCPTWEQGVAWDLREMGSAWGRGVREGPAPQEARKISSQCSAREEATWRRKKKEGRVEHDEEEPVRTE